MLVLFLLDWQHRKRDCAPEWLSIALGPTAEPGPVDQAMAAGHAATTTNPLECSLHLRSL
jgi:hypothetical protein